MVITDFYVYCTFSCKNTKNHATHQLFSRFFAFWQENTDRGKKTVGISYFMMQAVPSK